MRKFGKEILGAAAAAMLGGSAEAGTRVDREGARKEPPAPETAQMSARGDINELLKMTRYIGNEVKKKLEQALKEKIVKDSEVRTLIEIAQHIKEGKATQADLNYRDALMERVEGLYGR